MVHPATQRAVRTAITALGVPLDIGFVFPPKPGEDRGSGQWTNRDLTPGEVMALLPRASAANARGRNIFMRLGPGVKDSHPGIVMLDDLDSGAVEQLSRDGLEPCLVVETSPGNFQAWIRLIATGSVPYSVMGMVARSLANTYGGDERAVSPRQPGRIPGFTNRKPKHLQDNGQFPYVRLTHADPGRVAGAGESLVAKLVSDIGTGGGAEGAYPETPRIAAGMPTDLGPGILARLDVLHQQQAARIRRELVTGRRPVHAASQSEVDFAMARAAIDEGIDKGLIAAWLARARPEKDPAYPERTIEAVEGFRLSR